jgi:lipopolysaccharide transport system ATP-binding protein
VAQPAISIDRLSKRYRIGQSKVGDGLRHAVERAVTAPWRALRLGHGAASRAGGSSGAEFWALKDVSFDVVPGEVVGIIGRNGAGKTTLLKVISRITEPTAGRIHLRGRVASLLEVGTGFHPELTGRENIFLNGAILGMTHAEIRAKFDQIVAFAEVERFLDTPVKRYSSGMYVRLAFAVAAHLEPDILIIDEVLAVGDAAFQKKCLGKMKDVASEQGRTVLFVSHNMAAVTQLCDRSVWLMDGAVQAIGASDRVVSSYLSATSTQVPERRWRYPGDAPGDDRVRVVAGRVLQAGQVTGVVDINDPCRVEIEFEVLQPARNLLTGINLYDIHGTCIFNTVDWRESMLPPGRYRKHVDIPAQTLAEGVTRVLVRAVFYEPDVMSAVIPDALTFEAMDSDHPLAVRGHYKDTWPGVVRLRLPWSDAVPVSAGLDAAMLPEEVPA